MVLARAVEMEPSNTEYKLVLADEERLSNQCDKALPRYKELLDAPGADRERVLTGAKQCPTAFVIEARQAVAPPPVPPEPTIVYQRSVDTKTIAVITGMGVCLGGSLAMFLASRDSRSDADDARSYADHERIAARADREEVYSAVLLAGAIGLGGYAFYRLKFQSERPTEVAVTARADGGALVVRGSW